jgi:adenine-specific DNA-methyltransferase
MTTDLIRHARELRQRQTKAESLLWNVLRAKRLCNTKFRRQHPVLPFVADFACCELRWIVEIDGGYHDYQYEGDENRTQYLQKLGWQVVRFGNEDVIADVEAVAIAIAKTIGLTPEIARRVPKPSGMMCPRPKKPNRKFHG